MSEGERTTPLLRKKYIRDGDEFYITRVKVPDEKNDTNEFRGLKIQYRDAVAIISPDEYIRQHYKVAVEHYLGRVAKDVQEAIETAIYYLREYQGIIDKNNHLQEQLWHWFDINGEEVDPTQVNLKGLNRGR